MIGKLTVIRGLLGKVDSGSALIVVVGMLVRMAFASVAWNSDFYNFALMGSIAYHNPGTVFGVYTGPAYFMAGFYAIWIALPIAHSDSSYNFAMKVPSLIFDFLTALLIYRILSQTNLGKSRIRFVLAAWLLNPLTLIAGGGNFVEVVPAFLLLLSSFLAAQKKLLSASVALTVGGLLRLVPFISLPFLLAIPVRARDWKGAIKTALPVGLVAVGVLVWTVLVNPNLFGSLTGAALGGGLSREEIFDLLGVELSTNIVPYPANTVAMTALAYLLLLFAISVLPRNQSHVIAKELYLPILAYLAFSFTASSFFMYAIPFALILMANFKGYKVPIVFLSIVGCLWTAVRSPDYLASPTYLFSIPCQYWNLCNLTAPFHEWELLLQSYLRPQITAAWTALLLFLAVMSLTQVGLLRSIERVRLRSRG